METTLEGRRPRRRFTPEFRGAAVSRVEAGETMAEVARSLGIERGTLHAWCKVDPGTARARKTREEYVQSRPSSPAPQEIRDAVVRDLVANLPWKTIRDRYGISDSTIWRWGRRHGGLDFASRARIVATVDDSVRSLAEGWWETVAGPGLGRDAIVEIVQMLSRRMSYAAIAFVVGRSETTVSRIHGRAVRAGIIDATFIRHRPGRLSREETARRRRDHVDRPREVGLEFVRACLGVDGTGPVDVVIDVSIGALGRTRILSCGSIGRAALREYVLRLAESTLSCGERVVVDVSGDPRNASAFETRADIEAWSASIQGIRETTTLDDGHRWRIEIEPPPTTGGSAIRAQRPSADLV